MQVSTGLGERQFRLLNLRALLRAKLGAFFGRSESKDMEDIRFLIFKHPDRVYDMRAALNQEHRQHFMSKLAAMPSVSKAEVNKAKHALAVALSINLSGTANPAH